MTLCSIYSDLPRIDLSFSIFISLFIGEGEPHIDGDAGDFIVQIQTGKHRTFERRENDLYTNVSVTLRDALVGFGMNVTHLDGHNVVIKKEAVTSHGEMMVIHGQYHSGSPYLSCSIYRFYL